MATVLVTGASGFIGSWVVEQLLKKGDTVRTLARRVSAAENLAGLTAQGLTVQTVLGDYTDLNSLRKAVEGADYIYHVAGVTKALDEQTYISGNVTATENLLRAVHEANPSLKKFLHVSSGAACGPSPTFENPIDETAVCKPVTLYGKTKRMAETVCETFFDAVPVTVVRPCIVYGERDKDLLEHFKAVKSGIIPVFGFGVTKRYDYVYVNDLVAGMIAAAEHSGTASQYYFLSGSPHTWEEVGDTAKAALQKSIALKIVLPDWLSYAVAALSEDFNKSRGKISILNRDRARDGEQRYWTFSSEKAKHTFNYQTPTSLRDGFEKTVKWYREKKWL
jgi:dihydroflavonol-4-reductase